MDPTPQSQLDVIYRQLGRSSGFRGFTPSFLLAVAAAAAVVTLLLAVIAGGWSLERTAGAWAVAGVVIGTAVLLVVLVPALRSSSRIRRAAARATGKQMVLPLAVGVLVTVAVLLRHPTALPLLPAVWLTLFGLAISGLSGVMRERVEYVALFYIAAGVAVYLIRPEVSRVFTWSVGIPFTTGHVLTAALLSAHRDGGAA